MQHRTLFLAVLSGLLLTASLPPLDLSLLAWIGLAPLLLALRGATAKQGFLLGLLTGIVLFGGTIYWVTNSVHFYGGINLVVASGITLLLCAYCALYVGLFGAAVAHIDRTRPALLFLAVPAVWTALEYARTYVFSGFPWSLLGYAHYRSLHILQVADITGVYGLSFLTVFVNAAAAGILADRKHVRPLIAAAVVLAAVAGYGSYRMGQADPSSFFRIALVQGNIEQDRKWDPAYQSEVIETYHRLTRRAAEARPDLVIWPETATPFYFGGADRPYPALSEDLRRFVRGTGTPLLFGSPTYERKGRGYLLRNSAFFMDGNGAVSGAYHKHHLVPFGEYIPLKSSILFFLEKLVDAIGDFQGGSAFTVVAVRSAASGKDVPVSTVICYEIIFPDLVRRFVDSGARVMTTVTNDAWFGRSSAPYQHFSMAVLRAVENRVPVARAANTGISGFIDSRGRILATSGLFREETLIADLVPAGDRKTFYTRFGDVFAWICALLSVIILAVPARPTPQDGPAAADRERPQTTPPPDR